MKINKKRFLLSGLLVMLLFVGTKSYAANKPTDETISGWVEQALIEDVRIISSDINVAVYDGIVTLSGSVRNLAAKNFAEIEAKKIKGVMGVLNKLTVKTGNKSDIDIVLNVQKRIINSPSIKISLLDITSVNGEVTLSGNVDSWSEAQQAILLATETVGVRSVINNMTIDYKTTRPDSEIKDDIEAKITRDVYLVGLPISVGVKNGNVKLSGTVGNAYQKDRAGDDAFWVANVKSVENNISVDWIWDEGVKNKSVQPTDAQVAINVKDELYEDLLIDDPFDIQVKASSGHVTLTGTVPSYYQKRLAEKDALDIAGVIWITNQLQVNPEWRDDEEILDDVVFSTEMDYALVGDDIDIAVSDAVVSLSGNVNTFFEKVQAESDAANVLGVVSVNNNIHVNWHTTFSDASIEGRVIDRLFADWETWPVAEDITVKVYNGKVTLTGSVNTWAEYNEAERVAYWTDGVWGVDNDLTINDIDYLWSDWYFVGPEMYIYNYDPYYEDYFGYYYYPYYYYIY